MFGTGQRPESKVAKLHSIAAVLRGRSFEGSFNTGGIDYEFAYQPSRSTIKEDRLELTGRLKLRVKRQTARARMHSLENVRATLIAAQGGIGTAPAREKQPPDVYSAAANLPAVESSGSLSFSGALYFNLAPLNRGHLGVPADMSAVQLNVRLAPRVEVERQLQAAYSSVVEALYGREPDLSAASAASIEINKLLAANRAERN